MYGRLSTCRTWLALAASTHAQCQEGGGQAEVAAQGYYLGIGSQMTATSGMAVKFQDFFPKVGLLRANLEAYRANGGIKPADNFVELRGLVRLGVRWNITGGDFRVPGSLLPNRFTNLFFPELTARGFQLEAGDDKRSVTLFLGQETLLGGARIPFRVDVPQKMVGVGFRQSFGRLQTGVRFLHLTSNPDQLETSS